MSNVSILSVISSALRGERDANRFLDSLVTDYTFSSSDSCLVGGWGSVRGGLIEVTSAPPSPSTEQHLHLVATMVKRLAKRTPAVESGLISSALLVASSGVAPPASVDHIVGTEMKLRGEVIKMSMELIFGGKLQGGAALDTLCSAVATNSVNSGVSSTEGLLTTLLNTPNLAPLPLLSIFKHVGLEAQSDGCPESLKSILRNATPSVLSSVVLSILVKANEEGTGNNPKLASTAITGTQYWCEAADLTIVDIFLSCGGKFLEAVAADSLYSNHQNVIDSVADFLDSILTRSKARIIENAGNDFDDSSGADVEKERYSATFDNILGELVSAIGLQRFRIMTAGEEVCRTMTRTASVVVNSSLHLFMSDTPPGSSKNAITLLTKAAAHANLNVSAMSIEVLTKLVSKFNLSPTLLPILQAKACWVDDDIVDPEEVRMDLM